MIDALLTEHDQDGTHGNITGGTAVFSGNVTASGFTVSGAGSGGGWDGVFSGTVTAVTANGNRNYDLTTSADNQALISPGMRLRTTRTVAAPTQCATFDGVNDYFSKSSPAGMTFTDDFVAGAWVKLSAYQNASIMTRFNGTSGWTFYVAPTGQLTLTGYNAGGTNYSEVRSYQSVPLNKWVHVSAQLDMSAFTATSTTSYIMMDGVEVPAFVQRGGTNPTALIQAGNLEIGSINSGTNLFPGKIAQAFVSSAKITQANVRTLYSQGLTSALITANNIISAYSLSNSLTDLNATNANNLTANGGVLATTADSPFGGQAGGTISSTLDYGIVAKVTASTITVNVAEGCTIPTSGGVSAVSYSGVKSPYGFPSQRNKWVLDIYISSSDYTQNTPTGATYYNPTGLNFSTPIGEFKLRTQYVFEIRDDVGSPSDATRFGFSTSTSSFTERKLQSATYSANSGSSVFQSVPVSLEADISNASATTYYGIMIAGAGTFTVIQFRGAMGPITVTAENAYL